MSSKKPGHFLITMFSGDGMVIEYQGTIEQLVELIQKGS
jgi:hypothetical protein